MKNLDTIMLKNAIRLVIGGAMFGEEIDIYEVPGLLKDLAEDYNIEIEKQAKPL